MSIDIDRLTKELKCKFEDAELYRDTQIEIDLVDTDDILKCLEQQQKEIEEIKRERIRQDHYILSLHKIAFKQKEKVKTRDEVIKDMINEYGHHIGFDKQGEFIKSKRKTFALNKARKLLNIKGDSDD